MADSPRLPVLLTLDIPFDSPGGGTVTPGGTVAAGRVRRPKVRRLAAIDVADTIEPLIRGGVARSGNTLTDLIQATAGGSKHSWPVWRSNPTIAQRRRGIRPRPLTAGKHSRDTFGSFVRKDGTKNFRSLWLGIVNDAPYTRALELGAKPNRHGWQRLPGHYVTRLARQVIRAQTNDKVRERITKHAATAINRASTDAQKTARRIARGR